VDRALFVYNPRSGPGSIGGRLDQIIGRFIEKGILVQPFRMAPNLLDNLLDEIKSEAYTSIIVSGGDGTVNLVVNKMLDSGVNLPLGIIPGGTCNDFARSLNIPMDYKKCLDIILAGKVTQVDVGLINEKRYFIGTCGGGNLVDVSFNTSDEAKRSFGPLAYYFKALGELPAIKPVKLKIRTDDEYIEKECLFFLIANGKHAGGFNNIIKEAELSDGLMDIIILGNCLNIDLPSLLFKVLNNDFINDPRVMWFRTRSCVIEGSGSLPVTIDGEKGESLPLSVKFINRALNVFVR
jgi:YegS/Rv2252/BmrU family lipid kinase